MGYDKGYASFIARVRSAEVAFDEELMYAKIRSRISRRTHRIGLSMGIVLLLLAIGTGVFYGSRISSIGSDLNLAEYIVEHNAESPNSITDYVLADR